MKDPEGLARFVAGLPDGHRHSGFFWAAMTAMEDGLDEDQVSRVEHAGIESGLDEEYVHRTIAEAREKNQ
jgi:hypothetical protein